MEPLAPQDDHATAANRLANLVRDTNLSTPTAATQSNPKAPLPQALVRQNRAVSVPYNGAVPPHFPQFSASTAEILKRLQANPGNATGTPAFEAKRAEVLQNYVTSDKLPTPPPIANSGRRGRGGRPSATPSTFMKSEGAASSASPVGTTPVPARGSGRGRGRGRGRGSGRGMKRKRDESVDDSDDDSDISTSYTPLPTRTKSGRNVNRPVTFVPTLPEPTQGAKRRKSAKAIIAAKCSVCDRSTDPGNNRIVFCDSCSTAYHQYCHDPPIDDAVISVVEKEWLCAPCLRSKQNVIEDTGGLVVANDLSIEDKRAYFSTLSKERLVTLLVHSSIRHPELPMFPPNVEHLIPDSSNTSTGKHPTLRQTSQRQQVKQPPTPGPTAAAHSATSPPNGVGSIGGTPRSQNMGTDSSEMDPAEAQLLGEIRSHQNTPAQLQAATAAPSASVLAPTHTQRQQQQQAVDEFDDGYDTDPPAHYPKAGNGLARTLRTESEDLQWLVDDNFEVFSHGWKGDGSGVGADTPVSAAKAG